MTNIDFTGLVYNLPIIISLIAFTRYFVGLKTWKNYPSLVLALAFYLLHQSTSSMISTVFAWGGLYFVIIAVATAVRYLIRKLKLNFYGRMAFIYLAGTLAGLAIIWGLSFTKYAAFATAETTIIAIFLITSIIDEAATLLFKKGSQEYIRRMFTTSLLGFTGGLLLTWQWWNDLLIATPAILGALIVFNIIVSLWSSLRLTEYIRFGSIIKSQK